MRAKEKTRYQVRPAVAADIPELARMQFEEQKEMLEHMGMTEISMREVARTRDFYRVQIEDKDVKLVVAEDQASKAIVGMGLGRVAFHDDYVAQETGEIVYLWIDRACRKTHMAEDIVAELAAFFRAHGAHSLTVGYAQTDHEAETLWQRLHFHPVWVTATATLDELLLAPSH